MNRVWAQFGVLCVLGLCSITALVALSGRSHSGEAAAADESSTIAAKPGVYAPCAPPVFTSTGAEAEGIQLLLRTPPAVDLSVPGLTHHAVLSRDSRARLRRHLEDAVATAVAAQHADGYWTIAWHQWPMPPMRVADTPATRLLATGHLLEWLTYLPPDLHPNASVYQSAAAWLLSTLTPTQAGAADYCATVHALCALRNLVDEADQQLDSQPVPKVATTWLP
jgi:hypothetical protein